MSRRLPPLNAIRAFEASARHGGFVAAAFELGVTPAAVSLQVRKLEGFYQSPLFDRLPSGVELTEVGAAIFAECAAALASIEATSGLVAAGEARSRIVISCINSLAQRWLTQHLAELASAVPDFWIEVRAEPDPVEFGSRGADLRITYGQHLYPQHDVVPLFTDQLVPLCTPEFAEQAALSGRAPEALRDEHLIHTWWSPGFVAYPTWPDWFAAAGHPRQQRAGIGPAANMPAFAIEMALAGMGVALGQVALASPDLAVGRLVAPFDVRLRLPNPYAIVTPRASRRNKRTAGIVEALRRMAGRLPD